MPYFDHLQKQFEQFALWADLRHEQRARLEPVMRRMQRELQIATKELQRLSLPAELVKCEPNDLASIRSLRPKGPRRMASGFPRPVLTSKLAGAWLARAAGCTLGSSVESWRPDEMESLAIAGKQSFPPQDYWAVHPRPNEVRHKDCTIANYLKGGIHYVPVDDDLAYTVLGLLILEEYGLTFTTDDVAKAWQQYIPIAWTAEEVTLRNLNAGVKPSKAAVPGNPYIEWIGADIRSDPWAYAAPGWPERAAEFAYRDAILSHRYSGVYGAMFFAAAISAAFSVNGPIEAIRIGLTEIPRDCRFARDIQWALRIAPKLRTWKEARAAVDKRFDGMHHVHTNNNACLTIFGLQLGECDVTKTLGMTIAMGLDNDCTAATAGSILGAIVGKQGVPDHWWKPFRNKTRTYLNGQEWFTNTDLVHRFAAIAGAVHRAKG